MVLSAFFILVLAFRAMFFVFFSSLVLLLLVLLLFHLLRLFLLIVNLPFKYGHGVLFVV